jgi:hypothetical protein
VSADAIARLARKTMRDLRTLPKSLINDYLLAASCREAGTTLITENLADFTEIRQYVTVDYRAPWPALATTELTDYLGSGKAAGARRNR